MSISKSLIFGAAFMLMTGGAALAARTSSQSNSTKSSNTANATVHEETGTVSSLTGSELVLARTVNGKQEETTFKLDSNTKKEGTIDKGAHVAVYYKDQNHERIATEIKVEAKKS
jgi:hypothetical protein